MGRKKKYFTDEEKRAAKAAYNAKWQAKFRKEQPERYAEIRRNHRLSEKYRSTWIRAHLKHKYGVTPEWYEENFKAQNGVCAICKKPESEKRAKVLSVDHNHLTGELRGLLCKHCNSLLGFAGDSKEKLKHAISYLEKYEKPEEAQIA